MRIIEQKFQQANARRQHALIQPPMFALWPRWKRCGWMAKKLGERWIYKVFREKRGEKATRSLFWKACSAAGLQPPRRKRPAKPIKLNKNVVLHKKQEALLANGNRIYYAGGNRPAANDWIIPDVADLVPDEAPAQARALRPGRPRVRVIEADPFAGER